MDAPDQAPIEAPTRVPASPGDTEALPISNETFDEDSLRRILQASRPAVKAYICLQVDVRLPHLAPGLTVNVAIAGGIARDANTGCWTAMFETSLGFDLSFKLLGFKVGVGFSVTGELDIDEVPIADAAGQVASGTALLAKYTPRGADPKKCHTKNWFKIVQTFIDHQYDRFFREPEARLNRTALEQVEQRQQAFMDQYSVLLGGSYLQNEIPVDRLFKGYASSGDGQTSRMVMSRSNLVWPAVSMLQVFRVFLAKLPAYANQVMERFDDKEAHALGTDNERAGSDARLRSVSSTGRFLARWPDVDKLDALKAKWVQGVTHFGNRSDERVLNFAKIMRLSEQTGTPAFWKELAISASNLMVRVIGDVVALFGGIVGADPFWDGKCDSLPASFEISENGFFDNVMHSYPWASSSTRPEARAAFLKSDMNASGRPHAECLKGIPNLHIQDWERPSHYPQMWCILAESAPHKLWAEGSQNQKLRKFVDATEPLSVSVLQACDTVSRKTQPLEEGQRIVWNEQREWYGVENSGRSVGILYRSDAEKFGRVLASELMETDDGARLTEAKKKGFLVATASVESRMECERTSLPTAFVRTFPNFAKFVEDAVEDMESLLLDINVCLEEELDTTTRVGHELPGFQEGDFPCKYLLRDLKMARLRWLAIKAVKFVRALLVRLGAENLVSVLHLKEHNVGFGPTRGVKSMELSTQMARDFFDAFGVGLTPKAYENKPHVRRTMTDIFADHAERPKRIQLEGRFWPFAWQMRDKLMGTADASHHIRSTFALFMYPPLQFSHGLIVIVQLATNDLCTTGGMPDSGLSNIKVSVKRKADTYSSEVLSENCRGLRVRPGDAYIEIEKCSSFPNAGNRYTQWRIRLGVNVMKLNTNHGGRFLAGSLHGVPAMSNISNILVTGSAVVGAAAGYRMADLIVPYLKHSNFAGFLLLMSSPAMTVGAGLGASAGILGFLGADISFKAACEFFLKYLSGHGVVSDWPLNSEPRPSPSSPFGNVLSQAESSNLLFGSLTFTLKDDNPIPDRKVKFRAESRQRVNLGGFNVPEAMNIQLYARLEMKFDLSPWLAAQPQPSAAGVSALMGGQAANASAPAPGPPPAAGPRCSIC